MAYLNNSGLTYFYTKIKAKFALAIHDHKVASTTENGFMSSGDKIKLDGIESEATKMILKVLQSHLQRLTGLTILRQLLYLV